MPTAELRTVLVDDERLARAEMRRLLAAHPEIVVVGEADGVDRAVEVIRSNDPDLLFLDIRMPDGSGFDVLERLDHAPRVVFTTAHDEHAVRAFEVQALDYLLKPVDPDRLAAAIARLSAEPPTPRPATGAVTLSTEARVFVRDGDDCSFIRLGDVLVFEADGSGTLLHLADRTIGSHRPLAYLERQLDPSSFFRCNRQQIVAVDAIERIDDWFGGQLVAILSDGTKVTLSRRRAAAFRQSRGL